MNLRQDNLKRKSSNFEVLRTLFLQLGLEKNLFQNISFVHPFYPTGTQGSNLCKNVHTDVI
jgi:hypothetical protein